MKGGRLDGTTEKNNGLVNRWNSSEIKKYFQRIRTQSGDKRAIIPK